MPAAFWQGYQLDWDWEATRFITYTGNPNPPEAALKQKLNEEIRKVIKERVATIEGVERYRVVKLVHDIIWQSYEIPWYGVWHHHADGRSTIRFSVFSAVPPTGGSMLAAIIMTLITSGVITRILLVILGWFALQTVNTIAETIRYIGEAAPAALGIGAIALLLIGAAFLYGKVKPREEEK